MNWNFITNKLPEPNREIVFAARSGMVYAGFCDEHNNFVTSEYEKVNNVYAWAYLPERPEDRL